VESPKWKNAEEFTQDITKQLHMALTLMRKFLNACHRYDILAPVIHAILQYALDVSDRTSYAAGRSRKWGLELADICFQILLGAEQKQKKPLL